MSPTSRPPRPSATASMSTSTSTSATGPALPYELWLNILRFFELRPLEFGHARPDPGFTARRSVLWSLCLTSPRLLDIARPLLYANIVLPMDGSNQSARQCLRLLRTVSQNPRLGRLVVSLAVPLQLATSLRWWESAQSLLPHDQVHEDHRHLFEAAQLFGSGNAVGKGVADDQRWVSQKLVALLICLLPRLQRLLVHAPADSEVSLWNLGVTLDRVLLGKDSVSKAASGSLDEEMQKLSIHGTLNGTNGTHSTHDTDPQQPLQRLTTLQVQQDPASDQPGIRGMGPAIGNSLGAILPTLKARSGRLDRLDLSEQYLREVISSRAATAIVSTVKELNLINLDHPGEVTVLLGAAKSLDALSLHLSHHASHTQPASPSAAAAAAAATTNDDYNMAILSRRDTLRSLSFTAPDFDPLELGYRLGPLGRLTCLAQLEQLTFLRVEPQLLIDWLEVNTWPRFLDSLPRSLARLAFRFRTRDEDMGHVWARSGVGAALASGDKWRRKLPQLRAIVLEPLPYVARVAEELAEGMRAVGITLAWVHEVL